MDKESTQTWSSLVCKSVDRVGSYHQDSATVLRIVPPGSPRRFLSVGGTGPSPPAQRGKTMTTDNTVLCPALYQRLQQVFGQVTVSNRGAPYIGHTATDPKTGRRHDHKHQSGEQYAVRCPFHHDRSGHLYFGHQWLNKPYQVHCFCGCLAGADGRKRRYRLRAQVLNGAVLTAGRPASPSADAMAAAEAAATLPQVRFPGDVVPLNQLPPDHHARRYLLTRPRPFDPDELALRYQVGYCTKSQVYLAEGRIIVPVMMNAVMVGWQGRWPDDLNWTTGRVPKYYFPPHTPKRQMLYGFDTARRYKTVVVVESMTDAWSVGTNAVALLGKTLSGPQRDLILRHWAGGHVVVLLDGDAAEDRDRMAAELGRAMPGRVLPVALPAGTDPGGLQREELWKLIRDAAAARGVAMDLCLSAGEP
jgi:hypothetical protein